MCDHGGTCEAGDFFFDHPEALDALRFATRAFEPFSDTLLAIPSTPGWTATFENPDNGIETIQLQNLSVPANTLILYAGGYDMPGNQVGEAGPGKTPAFTLNRGSGVVTGPTANDFTPWGGSIAFDTLDNGAPRNWHFDVDTLPAPGEIDFLTIAFHELSHAFGFGTAPSFDNLNSSGQFQGAATIQLAQSTVSLAADGNHWASGTTSPPYADPPLSALTASLVLGRRRVLTPLDYAALADLGWQVPDKLLGLLGDIDDDGNIDGRDFLRWQRSVGNTGVGLLEDADGSLEVDDYDLWLWQTNYGRKTTSNSSFAAVPEPCTIPLLFLSGISILRCRPLRQISRYR
ncbi:hypothetical protein [Bythopirellula polymerisocia]|nr:hypothetical protein [Bythopirellula polymerisocia]